MGRRSSGLIGAWAEEQRQAQRQREAEQREVLRQHREVERQRRAYERDLSRTQREQKEAYRRQREAEALRLTGELEARARELEGLLAAGCAGQAFRAAALREPEAVEPFAPGALGRPVPEPDLAAYLARAGRWPREQAEARARHQRDWAAASAAEAQRRRQLDAYRAQYDSWAAGRLAAIREHNAGIADMERALRAGEPETVVEYFSAALYACDRWPEGFPRQVSAAYDRAARQLVLDWELPGFEVVPEHKAVRYLAGADQLKEAARPVTQRRALYRDVLAQSVLLALRELFAADEARVLDSVALNGFVAGPDPATGRPSRIVLAAVQAERAVFHGINVELVSAVECLTGALGGRLSTRPDGRTAVRPVRVPEQVGSGVVSHGDGAEPDLLTMDPIAFEGLVAELFRARGLQALTTRRSNDGGVDVEAVDPDPISGGSILVQVKRYRNTVPPSAVRDLYGTVQGAGANKGVLVTTSGFGPGSYAFAEGKPLTLVSGTELVDLLHRHGLRGRLGPEEDEPGAGAGAGGEGVSSGGESSGSGDFNVLGMDWAGAVAVDVCALVCAGPRVLSEEHFVFYNNPSSPGGSVRMLRRHGGDRAAVRVAFDALPAAADRLVLVAAVDPEADPGADLAGFTDAAIRLRDPAGRELERLAVSEGRAGETALVLGSFRRRGGDWEFLLGGRGYRGGLAELVGDFGIEVA
ncbi:restriction endonuclease [Streptomyces sp. LP05-1]|uniref:Restriction endonuclease n=1 Tax=Streptomyces pyxinae TaxID=2970734 RepID=A0ABT2CT33_9ACTN|nr:restriction endonuclease [Streptomyces sp. LP05-1]MCS0639841.1 restriction endonuclease [Streptomyces sp. LP05-1]